MEHVGDLIYIKVSCRTPNLKAPLSDKAFTTGFELILSKYMFTYQTGASLCTLNNFWNNRAAKTFKAYRIGERFAKNNSFSILNFETATSPTTNFWLRSSLWFDLLQSMVILVFTLWNRLKSYSKLTPLMHIEIPNFQKPDHCSLLHCLANQFRFTKSSG